MEYVIETKSLYWGRIGKSFNNLKDAEEKANVLKDKYPLKQIRIIEIEWIKRNECIEKVIKYI